MLFVQFTQNWFKRRSHALSKELWERRSQGFPLETIPGFENPWFIGFQNVKTSKVQILGFFVFEDILKNFFVQCYTYHNVISYSIHDLSFIIIYIIDVTGRMLHGKFLLGHSFVSGARLQALTKPEVACTNNLFPVSSTKYTVTYQG